MEKMKTTLMIVLGNFILALAIVAFIIPTKLVMGGTTGISLMIHNLFGIRVSYVVFAIDALMLLYGLVLLGRKFMLGTLLSSILYPFFLRVLEDQPFLKDMITDYTLCSIFGGFLIGLGIGIVFRAGASTGGTDPIALSMNKYLHIPLSTAMYGVDLAVILMQVPFSEMEDVLYGIICVLVSSFTIGKVSTIGEAKMQVFTISKKSQEICNAVTHELNLGATLIPVKTGFVGEDSMAVMTVTHRRFLKQLEKTIIGIDPMAFMQITEVASVHGRGFTLDRMYLEDGDTGSNGRAGNQSRKNV
ncbi:MAG: YitT family protein [Lachnospiraceae bacterium]|nr:YitT family protein [Lachnospiraceae bacterium]